MDVIEEKIETFIKEIENICWFVHSEESSQYTVAVSFTEALDGSYPSGKFAVM